MVFEEITLIVKGGANGFILLNISLTSVDHRNITESQGNDSSGQNINDVRAFVPVYESYGISNSNRKTRRT